MGFLEDLSAAKAAVDAGDRVKTAPIPVVVNGALHSVVFYRSESADWARDTLKHPPREGVGVDRRNGYDLSGVTLEVAPVSGRVVIDGEETVLGAEQWATLFEVIDGATRRLIDANVWQLNENDPMQQVERLKKASSPRRSYKKKSG